MKLLVITSENGNVSADSVPGLMYADGRGIAKDEAKAMNWFRKSE